MLNKKFNLLLGGILIISGCKYDFHTNESIYKLNCPVVYIQSYDPYGYITILIKEKFRMNNIVYSDYQKNTRYKKPPCVILHIIHSSEQCIKTALFYNGESAEYQLIFTVTIKIETKNNKYRLFNIKTFRSFFDNPMAVLSNSVKKNNIRQIIYEEASEELINKLFL